MTYFNEPLRNPFGAIPAKPRDNAKADSTLADAELIKEFFSGNEGSFEVLVDRHLSMVYKFAYRYLGNADDARDVAQESFIKAWSHLERFDRTRNFKTWLLTITKNTALDFLKKKKPLLFSRIEAGDHDLDAFLAPYAEAEDLPDAVLEKKFAAADLSGALVNLPPAYRTVLALRYDEHLKFREIADVLQEPIDTVKSKHRRGLILLKKILA